VIGKPFPNYAGIGPGTFVAPGRKNPHLADYEAGLNSDRLLLERVVRGLGAVVTGGIDPRP